MEGLLNKKLGLKPVFIVVVSVVAVTAEGTVTTGRSVFFRPGLCYFNGPAIYRSLVELGNCFFRSCIIGHFHKAKAT